MKQFHIFEQRSTGSWSRLAVGILLVFLAVSVILILPEEGQADFFPKPQIIITVKNAPAETYYLDLLVQESPSGDLPNDNLSGKRDRYDPQKMELLANYRADGWHPALAHGTTMHLMGDLIGDRRGSDRVHTFSYFGTPERFKIVILTPENEFIVTPEIVRDTFKYERTFDYTTRVIVDQRTPLVLSYLKQSLSTLVPTLILEGLILLLFKFPLRLNWMPFLWVNLATQVLMTVTLGGAAIQGGPSLAFSLLIPVELVILLIEALAFARLLKPFGKGRRIAYAIVANIASAAAGIMAMTLVY